MCDIEDVVHKITPVFTILNPFCPKILWGSFCRRTQSACMYQFCKYKKENISVVGMSSWYSIDN